jgi:hypothetical protein
MFKRGSIVIFLSLITFIICSAQQDNVKANKYNGTFQVKISHKMIIDSLYFGLGIKMFSLSDSCKHILYGILKIGNKKYRVYDSTDFDEYGNNTWIDLPKGVYSFKLKCIGYYPINIPQYNYYPNSEYLFLVYFIRKKKIRR